MCTATSLFSSLATERVQRCAFSKREMTLSRLLASVQGITAGKVPVWKRPRFSHKYYANIRRRGHIHTRTFARCSVRFEAPAAAIGIHEGKYTEARKRRKQSAAFQGKEAGPETRASGAPRVNEMSSPRPRQRKHTRARRDYQPPGLGSTEFR